jgi:UDP-glucuronate decarboxylase
MKREDVPFYNKIRNECRMYLHDQSAYSVEQSLSWFDKNKPVFYIAIVDGVDVGYFRTSIVHGEVYVGMDISSEHRGKGFAEPLYKYFLDFVFSSKSDITDAEIRRVFLRVRSTNKRAFHVYDKLGFEKLFESYNQNINDSDILMMYTNPATPINILDKCVFDIISAIPSTVINEYRNNIIYITGSSGFVGSWLSLIFNVMYRIYDINLKILKIDYGIHDKDTINCNINDIVELNKIFMRTSASAKNTKVRIFNCAGIANPSSYMRDPVGTLDVSYVGTLNILKSAMELADRYKSVSVMLFSSSEIYGNPDVVPTPESYVGRIPTDGNRSCYDVGKQVLETLGNIHMDNVPLKIIRPFNFYGPLMVDTRIIPEMIRKYINGEDLYVFGDGDQTRSFCYVTDAMKYLLLLSSNLIPTGTYNVGNPMEEISMKDLAEKINNVDTKKVNIKIGGYPDIYPSDEPRRRCPDMMKTNLAIQSIGARVQHTSIYEGILETYKYNKR